MAKPSKIIEGMKQAIASAKCEHDWQTESATVWNGQIRLTSICFFCQSRKTEFKATS